MAASPTLLNGIVSTPESAPADCRPAPAMSTRSRSFLSWNGIAQTGAPQADGPGASRTIAQTAVRADYWEGERAKPAPKRHATIAVQRRIFRRDGRLAAHRSTRGRRHGNSPGRSNCHPKSRQVPCSRLTPDMAWHFQIGHDLPERQNRNGCPGRSSHDATNAGADNGRWGPCAQSCWQHSSSGQAPRR